MMKNRTWVKNAKKEKTLIFRHSVLKKLTFKRHKRANPLLKGCFQVAKLSCFFFRKVRCVRNNNGDGNDGCQ
jgi:hypothetical protein